MGKKPLQEMQVLYASLQYFILFKESLNFFWKR
jgi:hypothetical protein